MSNIGTLAETSLHAAIKSWLGQAGDRFEAEVGGYVIDIVRGRQLIEVQTGNFTAIKPKLAQLLDSHPVYLVYPVAREKYIIRQTAVGEPISRRKSPKRGRPLAIFDELVRIPHLLPHPNLSLGILMTQQSEIWRDDGRGSWRRQRWSIVDRQLLAVYEEQTFKQAADLRKLLPSELPQPFSNQQLADTAVIPLRLAQRITYTLHRCRLLAIAQKRGNAHLYAFTSTGTGQP